MSRNCVLARARSVCARSVANPELDPLTTRESTRIVETLWRRARRAAATTPRQQTARVDHDGSHIAVTAIVLVPDVATCGYT